MAHLHLICLIYCVLLQLLHRPSDLFSSSRWKTCSSMSSDGELRRKTRSLSSPVIETKKIYITGATAVKKIYVFVIACELSLLTIRFGLRRVARKHFLHHAVWCCFCYFSCWLAVDQPMQRSLSILAWCSPWRLTHIDWFLDMSVFRSSWWRLHNSQSDHYWVSKLISRTWTCFCAEQQQSKANGFKIESDRAQSLSRHFLLDASCVKLYRVEFVNGSLQTCSANSSS